LGEWAGLAKYDKEGNVKKARPSSCVVIKSYGEPSDELSFLLAHIKVSKDASE